MMEEGKLFLSVTVLSIILPRLFICLVEEAFSG